jgi:hypothetical protein
MPLLPPTAVDCLATNPTATNTRLSVDNSSAELVSRTASSRSLAGKAYSPECVEEEFSEVRIQYFAYLFTKPPRFSA